MFVVNECRGKRIGEKILVELEHWARELGYENCVLFTGSRQPEANRLYTRNGYLPMEKYSELINIPDSICFAKQL